jgi:transposase
MAVKTRGSEESRKAAALRQHGSLNPRPEGVGNDLFSTYDFFDPKDMVQVKYEMLRQVSVERGSVTEAAAQFGLSRPSFYEAQAAFQQDGLVGLLPDKRGPRRAHKLSEEIMEFLQKEKAGDPDLSGAALAEKLWKERRLRVHRRSIERALARREKNCPCQRWSGVSLHGRARAGRTLRRVASAVACGFRPRSGTDSFPARRNVRMAACVRPKHTRCAAEEDGAACPRIYARPVDTARVPDVAGRSCTSCL